MRRAFLALAVFGVSFWAAACDDGVVEPHAVDIRAPAHSTRHVLPSDYCAPEDPTCTSGEPCSLSDPFCERGYFLATISGNDSVYANSGEPAYNLAEGEYGPYFCPAYIDDPHFVWRGHHFSLNGRAFKQHELPYTSGISRARYVLPNGPWTSDDGKARIWSGTADATCFTREHRVFGIRITEGYVVWSGFRGDGQELSADQGGMGVTWVSWGDGDGGYIPSDAASSAGPIPGRWHLHSGMGDPGRWRAGVLSAIVLAAGILYGPATDPVRSPAGADLMADTLPYGNRFGFPFTREELVRAQMQVMPREEAEAVARAVYDQDAPEVIGVHVADGNLLLLALLSEDLAARVVAYRPALREMIERFRQDTEAALAEWRTARARS